jgi:hypothetical protein
MEEVISNEVSAPEVVDSAVSVPDVVNTTPSEVGSSEENAPIVPEKPAYQPSYKVKTYDKEYDIPERFKGLLTDEASEKEVKEFLGKAFAFETLKEKNERFKNDYEKVNTNYTSLSKSVDTLGKYLNNDDFDSFFDTLKVPEAKLQQWMLQKLQLKELPPEQQAIYNKKSEYQKQLYNAEQEREYYKGQYETFQTQQNEAALAQVDNQLNQLLSDPKVDQTAKSFDQRLNQPGAFKKEVIQRAYLIEQTSGVRLTPDQAVAEVMKLYGFNQPVNPSNNVVAPQDGIKKPTLPTVSGKTTSPAAQQIKSIDDLKKIRTQILNQERSEL